MITPQDLVVRIRDGLRTLVPSMGDAFEMGGFRITIIRHHENPPIGLGVNVVHDDKAVLSVNWSADGTIADDIHINGGIWSRDLINQIEGAESFMRTLKDMKIRGS